MDRVRVLVVDDQAVFRDVISAVVAVTDGFAVVGRASSGEEALTAVSALHPNLVLMDVHLPGLDGIETARRLHAQREAPVVVLLSTDRTLEADLAECGVAAYVPKDELGPDRLVAVWAQGRGLPPDEVRSRAGTERDTLVVTAGEARG